MFFFRQLVCLKNLGSRPFMARLLLEAEVGSHLRESLQESVHVFGGVVDVCGGAGRGGHAGAAVQRLGAVVTHAHGDALGVEQLAHVVRVHAVDSEGYQAGTLGGVGGAEQAHAFNLLNALNQASAQFVFPCLNVLHTQVLR